MDAERFPRVSLPRTELAARSKLTIPLYPHMTEAEKERVIAGLNAARDAPANPLVAHVAGKHGRGHRGDGADIR